MRHALVVDDDLDLANIFKDMLQVNNFLATVAPNGVEALKVIMSSEVDAIFCDMMMPHMPGDMFYAAVQRVKPHLCPRFIFVTGYQGNPKFEAFFREIKAVVLYKPVTLGKMKGTLDLMFKKPVTAENTMMLRKSQLPTLAN